MAINPKEKAALGAQWGKSKPAAAGRLSSCEWPDGEYQFEVTTWEPDAAKARIKAGYTLIGGNDSLVGQEHLQHENLTGSDESMGYFKARLMAFGIPLDDIDAMEIDGVLGDELKDLVMGKKFVGQAKTKNDYLNVYANRPIEGDGEEAAEETAEEATEEAGELEAGSRVQFVSQKDGNQVGELVEIDGDKATVKGDNGKVYKLPASRVTAEAAAEEATEEAAEEEAVEEEAEEPAEKPANAKKSKLPLPKAIQAMKAPELKQLFQKVGLKFEAVKQPREFLVGVAGFIHDKKYMPAISQLPALSAGLGVKQAKGAKPADVVKELRQKALAKFS